jgi:rhamnosyltransferase
MGNHKPVVDGKASMAVENSYQQQRSPRQGVVIPLYGPCPPELPERVKAYALHGLLVVLVQNNPEGSSLLPPILETLLVKEPEMRLVFNHNRGGVAGGFNRGIETAIAEGVKWITLLDQDSRLSAADFERLIEPWLSNPGGRLLIGPMIWDGRRDKHHGRRHLLQQGGYIPTRLLISSGTTFKVSDWPLLGPMDEWLMVDFVDHLWGFRAQERGFLLLHHPQVILHQEFGQKHPHPLCHLLGMELYSPMRHFYSLRNLRWLLRMHYVPLDLKIKEMVKMMLKPWLWLLCEPRKAENLQAIIQALRSPLPLLPMNR